MSLLWMHYCLPMTALEEQLPVEMPDVHTASDEYAGRFSGSNGQYILDKQSAAILSMLEDRRGVRVLDVGGGHAQIAPILSKKGYDVWVTGSTKECAIRLEKSVADPDIHFVIANLLKLPFDEKEYHTVVSLRQLAHIENWERFIAELCRVSGERVIIEYPTLKSFNFLSRLLFRFKKKIEKNTRPFKCFHDREIVQEFQRHGFRFLMRKKQFFLPIVCFRMLPESRFLVKLEEFFSFLGLTELFGSPVIIEFVRFL